MVKVQLLVGAALAAPAAIPYRNLNLDILRDGTRVAFYKWRGFEGWLDLRLMHHRRMSLHLVLIRSPEEMENSVPPPSCTLCQVAGSLMTILPCRFAASPHMHRTPIPGNRVTK